jgi:DNA-binding response OmpR family regulator
LSNSDANNSTQSSTAAAATARPRRALIVADAAGLGLQQQLTVGGYLTQAATIANAPRAIGEFSPDVIMMIVAHAGGDKENECLALARKLRAETATYALPIVFAWSEDERSLRAAAQYTGADDYFPLNAPAAEILARLDSLFWRVESDRRSAPVVSDRRLEIDNFMFMLDAVREDVRAGSSGTLSLIYAVSARGKGEALDKAVRDRTLVEAHNFLKLNLRRVDAVAYYGPTTLLLYLPRMEALAAVAALSRLHREFHEEHPERDLVAGVASFPANGLDVEGLIERAEEAVNKARKEAGGKHVIAYEGAAASPAPVSSQGAEPALSPEPSVQEELQLPKEVEADASQAAPVSRLSAEIEQHEAGREEIVETPAASPVESVEAGRNGAGSGPEDEAARAASEAAAADERERRASGAIMPRRLLLTISDAARMTQLNSLIRSAGYEARAAFNGQQALDLLRIERQDLLLLDYDLQGIDGVETIRRLRKQSGGRLSLPVIMLLSADNEGARREALELGARSVLQTPYDPAELLASLRLAGSVE